MPTSLINPSLIRSFTILVIEGALRLVFLAISALEMGPCLRMSSRRIDLLWTLMCSGFIVNLLIFLIPSLILFEFGTHLNLSKFPRI